MKVVVTERINQIGIDLLRQGGLDVDLIYETDRNLEEALKEADGAIVRIVE